jgi:hypothetical protein
MMMLDMDALALLSEAYTIAYCNYQKLLEYGSLQGAS